MNRLSSPIKVSEIALQNIHQVIPLDWNGDGITDLAVVHGNTISLYEHGAWKSSSVTLNPEETVTQILPLHGNHLAIVFGNDGRLRVYRNKQKCFNEGFYSEFSVHGVSMVAAMDLSKNGKLNDLAVVHSYGKAIKFYRCGHDGEYIPVFRDIEPHGHIEQVVAFDLSGSGRKADLAILVNVQRYGRSQKVVKIYQHRNNDEFVLAQTIEPPLQDISRIAPIQVNGRPGDDLAVFSGGWQKSVLLYCNTCKNLLDCGSVQGPDAFTYGSVVENRDLFLLIDNQLQFFVNQQGHFTSTHHGISVECHVDQVLTFYSCGHLFIVLSNANKIEIYKMHYTPAGVHKHSIGSCDLGCVYLILVGLLSGALIIGLAWLIRKRCQRESCGCR